MRVVSGSEAEIDKSMPETLQLKHGHCKEETPNFEGFHDDMRYFRIHSVKLAWTMYGNSLPAKKILVVGAYY